MNREGETVQRRNEREKTAGIVSRREFTATLLTSVAAVPMTGCAIVGENRDFGDVCSFVDKPNQTLGVSANKLARTSAPWTHPGYFTDPLQSTPIYLESDNRTPFRSYFVHEHQDISHLVRRGGAGPGVILLHELPGFTPEFWRFANWLLENEFLVYAPDLYSDGSKPSKQIKFASGLPRACISREINLFARNKSSPIVDWLRPLVARLSEDSGREGIGVIGMCMTGNFALSLVTEKNVVAPIASQPALPLGIGEQAHSALHLSAVEKDALNRRDIEVMALRFDGDPVCRASRFDSLRELTGESRLKEIVLPDCAQNPDGNRHPHAVLTKDLVDESGSITRSAAESVIRFLSAKLK